MIAASVSTWERSYACFVDVEALGCLVVNLPIRGMSGCCLRQLVGVESVGKGELVALCKV